MQANSAPARRGNPAVQQGLIFGVVVGVLFALNTILGNVVNIGAAGSIIGILFFLIELFLYALAGFRASAQTGKLSTGVIAGLLTGLIGGIIGAIVTIIVAFANADALRLRSQAIANQAHLNIHYTNALIISGAFVGALVGLALAIGYGALFGLIGGAIGRRRAPQTQYQESFYQGLSPNQQMPYNQGYPQDNQGYPPVQTDPYNQQPQYNQAPQQYNQPPQQGTSDPYNQGLPPTPPPGPNSY
jgi:hypothetical protein